MGPMGRALDLNPEILKDVPKKFRNPSLNPEPSARNHPGAYLPGS